MDGFSTYYPVHALGHPFGIAIQAAGLLAHGNFERFPKIRRRFSRRRLDMGAVLSRSPGPFVPPKSSSSGLGQPTVGGPRAGEKASDYLRRQMRDGRVYVGFDVDDDGLGFAVQKAGREAFIFGSDFPHEVFNAEKCRHEIDQLLARGDLNDADKAAVLGGNAKRFYGLDGNGR